MRLALAAGRVVDVAAFSAEMTAETLGLWRAYDRREPFGGASDWSRAAMTCAATVNANPFRGTAVAKLADFLPGGVAERAPESRQERRANARKRREGRKVTQSLLSALSRGIAVYGADGRALDMAAVLGCGAAVAAPLPVPDPAADLGLDAIAGE